MLELIKCKFYSHKDIAEKLIKTGSAEIVEGNTWGDMYWGVCNNLGDNNLGKIIMMVRCTMCPCGCNLDRMAEHKLLRSSVWEEDMANMRCIAIVLNNDSIGDKIGKHIGRCYEGVESDIAYALCLWELEKNLKEKLKVQFGVTSK